MVVTASVADTWAAALEFLALSRAPLRIVDGVSHFAVTDPFLISLPATEPGADCGRDAVQSGIPGLPREWTATVTLSLHVVPAGNGTSIRAVAQFRQSDRSPCGPSNGTYERHVQQWIRDRATRKP